METPAADLEVIAREVAFICGRLITEERPDRLGVAATKSSDVDIVTVMDKRSEELAAELLRKARPDDGQFGEEGLNVAGTTGITWVVDPIDGTVNYLYGIPAFAVSVAAVTGDPGTPGGWTPVAGAVYNPSVDELFSASVGGGARLSRGGADAPLRTEPATSLGQTLLATGFSYSAERRQRQADALAGLIARVRDIRRLGSAALDLCHVAAGRVDAYYERGVQPWDIAAGCVIASEAGAETRIGPDNGFGTLVMAGRPETLDEIVRVEP